MDPYLVGMVVHVAKNNKLSLLMVRIWLVRSFASRRKTSRCICSQASLMMLKHPSSIIATSYTRVASCKQI